MPEQSRAEEQRSMGVSGKLRGCLPCWDKIKSIKS